MNRVNLKDKSEAKKIYSVYILRTSSNTLYVGQTNNLEKRIKEHKAKASKSAKYIRSFKSFELVYQEAYATRKEAMQREHKLKTWKKVRKEQLVETGSVKALELTP